MPGGTERPLGRVLPLLRFPSTSLLSRPSKSSAAELIPRQIRISSPRLSASCQRNSFSTSTRNARPARQLKTMSGSPFFSRSSSWDPATGLAASFLRRHYSSGGYGWDGGRSARAALWTLLGINAAVFGTWQYAVANQDRKLAMWFQTNCTLSWQNINAGRWHTLLTCSFAHMGLGHFAFNMMAMYAFGTILSAVPGVGAASVFGLAIGSALCSSAAFLAHRRPSDQTSTDRKKSFFSQEPRVRTVYSALGASGVAMGMSASAALLQPTARIALMFVPMPLWVASCIYVGVDLFFLDAPGSRVGHAAHLGGFVFGAVYYLTTLRRFGGIWQTLRRFGRG